MTPQDFDFATEAPRQSSIGRVGEAVKAVKAVPVAMSPGTTCRAAFPAIARACIAQIVANRPLARAGHADGLHQMRVGLRRLRAAIWLFRGMLDDPQSAEIRDGLKWIAGELGPARELDVFIGLVVGPAAASAAPPGPESLPEAAADSGFAVLLRDLRRQRGAAAGRARRALDSERFEALLRHTSVWIDGGAWSVTAAAASASDIRDRPVSVIAAAEMHRLQKRIVKRGRHLAEMDPARRHRLRIRAKKLRYAADFFAGAFPGKKAARRQAAFAMALGRLQDTLGELNDIVVHRALLAGLTGRSGSECSAADLAFAAGRLAGREEVRAGPLLAEATEAWAAFAAARPFWR